MDLQIRDRNGYTLIELASVLLILVILLSIAMPRALDIRNKWVLDSIAKQMVEDMRWAQNMAVSECLGYYFELNMVDSFYRIRSEVVGSPTLKRVELDPVVSDISCTFKTYGDYKRLAFSSTGIPSQTGSIYLKTQKGKTIKITVAVGTGRVAITHDGS